MPSGHWESLLFAFSKLQILLMRGVRERGEWSGNKVHLRAFLAGAAELSRSALPAHVSGGDG